MRLAPSTVATLLKSLVALEQVEKVASNGHYRLGRRLLRLGRIVEKQVDLLELGRPGIIRLCQSTGETVNFLVPSATAMIVAESLKGDIVLKTSALKGTGLPLRGTASGKCFQAFGSAAPGADLAAIRRLGYATEEDEFQPGVIAVAVPISGRPRADSRHAQHPRAIAPIQRAPGRAIGQPAETGGAADHRIPAVISASGAAGKAGGLPLWLPPDLGSQRSA